MPARTPKEVEALFPEAMNARDIDAMLALYEPDTVFVPEPGQAPVQGEQALRAHLRTFTDAQPELSTEVRHVVQAGDIALSWIPWSMKRTRADGTQETISGRAVNVVRRQPDGTWRTLIDNPFFEEYWETPTES